MNIHEYQAKEILNAFGIPIPRGRVALPAAWEHLGRAKPAGPQGSLL